jgi:hypothetical protein
MRTTYTAVVQVATDRRLDVDDLVLALADYRAELTTSGENWQELRLTLSAANLSHACVTAISVATAATGAAATSCQVAVTPDSGRVTNVNRSGSARLRG